MIRVQYSAIIVLSAILLNLSIAHAVKPVYSGGRERAAIRGYDPVAYFVENAPVKGLKEYQLEHNGGTWWFSSAENLEKFAADPEKYMPAYGGYCAYAISRNSTASSKPEYFTIHDGKLYLNYSKSVYKKWLKDKEGYISSADSNWPGLVDK